MKKQEFVEAITHLYETDTGTYLWSSALKVKVIATRQPDKIVIRVVGTDKTDIQELWDAVPKFTEITLLTQKKLSKLQVNKAYSTINKIQEQLKKVLQNS